MTLPELPEPRVPDENGAGCWFTTGQMHAYALAAVAMLLSQPVAETVMDICADHEGPIEAMDYLPCGTMLYSIKSNK